ncbi:MAG: hypothetical protein FWG98_06200, partial [Candidatus Cloacimonetes bacterium]|nr:hypothetical protein [Candidatus Cloacimonadota bacterium]
LRIEEIGDFCYGWGKSEISATDGGNRRFLLRMGEIGDFCYGDSHTFLKMIVVGMTRSPPP